ncbi:MAG: tetratricopeptide repeat protein [FCB group bacterium]|jgi:tol-pal system protein YbgF|nr:tetratricopeptide repeat protein [FCB group bacterium]
MRRYLIAGSVLLLPLAGIGCATGNNDMMNTVYNTNRIVRNLEQNLTPTVNKLNQTTADLGARVDASEQQTSRMAQQMESSTALLQQIQQQMDQMQKVVYRNAGMTPPQPGAPIAPPASTMQVGPIVQEETVPVEGQMTLPGPTTAVPAPPGGPNENDILDNPAPMPAPTGTPGEIGPTMVPVQPTETAPPPPPVAEPAAGGDAAQDIYKKAGAEFYAGNFEQARNLYDEYLEKNPNGKDAPNAQFWKGESQLKLNRYKEAIQEFEQLRKNYPTNSKVPYSMYEQAEAQLKLGQTNEAVAMLKQLIAEWPMTRPAAKAKADLEKRGIQ